MEGVAGPLLGHGGAAETALIYGDRTERLSPGATYRVAGVARLAKGIPYGSDLKVTAEDQRPPDEAQPCEAFSSFDDCELSSSEDSGLLDEGQNSRSNRKHRVRIRKSWRSARQSPSTKSLPVVQISNSDLVETPKWPTVKRSSTLWIDRSDPRIEAFESQWASNSQKAWNTQRLYDLQRASPRLPPPVYISRFCRTKPTNLNRHTISKRKSSRDVVEKHRAFKYFRITSILPISVAWEAIFWGGFFAVLIATPILLITILKVPPKFLSPASNGMYFVVKSQQSSYQKFGVQPTISVILRRHQRETNNEKLYPVYHYGLRGILAGEVPYTALQYRNDIKSRQWTIGDLASSLIRSQFRLPKTLRSLSSTNAHDESTR